MNKAIPVLSSALAIAMAVSAAIAPAVAQDAMKSHSDAEMSSDKPVADTWITTKVKAEMATTDDVKSMDVDVKTVNGVVMLTGVLANDVAVKKAVAAAESVKGVKRVDASGLKSKE